MGNQKSISLPPDWRDELLEGTTEEIQKEKGEAGAARQPRRAALPWIKLLAGEAGRMPTRNNATRARAPAAHALQGDVQKQPPRQAASISCLSMLDH